LFCVAAVYGQVRPKPAEIFESEAFINVKRGNDTFDGEGKWRVDQPDGKAREQFRFDIRHKGKMDYDFLQRFDMGKEFEIAGNPERCSSKNVTGKMPAVWGWLQSATYKGKVTIRNRSFDLWSFSTGGVTLSLAVHPTNVNIPVIFERKTPSEEVAIHFINFHTAKPHPVWFTVPPLCKGKLHGLKN